ncbi:hypothetical protein QBC42DRAFT_291108 [Cladorrhinum samala]|uniref:RanBP2-type domain-containing protein n=1 Tax=Cladorrhinum samala TaxID=585594 RepID=A0AAV9HEF2_9PEZI|nr:hypothetical protein QBC42DRAFT_291108 [Cladorrhinum samala]
MAYTSFDLVPPAPLPAERDPLEHLNGPVLGVSSGKRFPRFDDGSDDEEVLLDTDDSSDNTNLSTEVSSGDSSDSDSDRESYYDSDDGFIEEFGFVRKRVSPVARRSLIAEGLRRGLASRKHHSDEPKPDGHRDRRATTGAVRDGDTTVRLLTPLQSRDRERGKEIRREALNVKIEARHENRLTGEQAVIIAGWAAGPPSESWVCCCCSALNSGYEWRCSSCKSHGKCEGCEVAAEEIDGNLGLESE